VTKRKKQFFPPKVNKRAPSPAGSDDSYERPNLATINMQAGAGKAGFSIGDKVQIEGNGLYSGEIATIEKLNTGVIPSAFVRTASGNTRQVRTIDLSPARPEPVRSEAAATTEQASSS
jgi:hypothetical protein